MTEATAASCDALSSRGLTRAGLSPAHAFGEHVQSVSVFTIIQSRGLRQDPITMHIVCTP